MALSSDQANQLWEEFRHQPNPHGMPALDRLYRALRKPVVEFCRLRGCDPELADELAEQAFVRLIHRKPRARRGFIPLLYRTVQNLCVDARKVRRRAGALSQQAGYDDSVSGAERGETVRAVRDCLSRLAPEEHAFFSSVAIRGLTQRAAGELLGWRIAPSTLHKRYVRLRERVRRCLQEKKIL